MSPNATPHRGAIRLRLVDAVAEALEERQLHGRILIAEALQNLDWFNRYLWNQPFGTQQ